jgi:hypothetical protein
MIITSTIKNIKRILHFKLDSKWAYLWAWLLVLVAHPHDSPQLTLHANSSPNGLLCPMPSTHPSHQTIKD